jgi:thiol-disulfide isomerase/thioredoxin
MTEPTAPGPSPRRGRRALVVGGVAAGAALAGAGLGLWRSRVQQDASDAGAFWSMTFMTPQGQTLATASLRGSPLLLNFWATWCPPCVEEFPMLDTFFRQHRANGWQVLGLAIDQPSAVRVFLTRTPVSFPVGLAGLEGTELAKSLGNDIGGLPFSVVLGADGAIRERRMGRLSPADLQRWASLR